MALEGREVEDRHRGGEHEWLLHSQPKLKEKKSVKVYGWVESVAREELRPTLIISQFHKIIYKYEP